MVYIQTWQSFQQEAESLYANAPKTARYSVKWNATKAKLVLKITDNVRCIKYKTHSSAYLNRFEALNLSLMQKMVNHAPLPPTAHPETESKPSAQPIAVAASNAVLPLNSSAVPAAGGSVASGGVKKKKKGKKK